MPVRNEEDNIPRFVAAVESLPLPADVQLQMLFVEDGSRDGTLDVLRRLAGANPRVRYFALANGLGEGPAVMFGVSRSRADAMIMMAVESHPPELIPGMIEAFCDGAQVVQCVRDSLQGRRLRRDALSAIFPTLMRAITGFDYRMQNVYYRLMSHAFAQQVLAAPRFCRFLRFPLPDAAGGALRLIHTDMIERDSGQSQYSVLRLAALGLDGILAFLSLPRLVVFVLASILAVAVVVASGHIVLALVIGLASFCLAGRWLSLRRIDYVGRLLIRESSDGLRGGDA